MATIGRSNPNGFEVLAAKLKQLDGVETKVGWFSSARYETGQPVAGVMAIQEFGSGPIPPRPFFRTTIAEQKQAWADYAAQARRPS